MRRLISQIIPTNPVIVASMERAGDVLERLNRDGIKAALVLNPDGSILGVAVQDEIKNLPPKEPVSKSLSSEWGTVPYDASLEESIKNRSTWIVPVREDGTPLGVIPRSRITDTIFDIYETTFNQFKTVLDSAHNGIIALDRDGIITHYNAAAEVMFGVPQQEAIGRHITEVDPESTLMDVVTSGQAQMTQKRQIPRALVMSNRRPIFRNGEVVGVVAVFQDISELESAYTELRSVQELNKELESILEFSHDGLAISDEEGRFVRVSPSFSKLVNIDLGHLIGQTASSLDEQNALISKAIGMVLENKTPVSLTDNSPYGQILATSIPVFDNQDQLVRIVTNLRDLSELNDLKQQVFQSSEQSRRYLEELEEWRARFVATSEVVASSLAMQRVVELALHVAKVDSTVLISGESGVGKEVVAKMIHRVSPRRNGPFIEINCGAIPETLLESELFGYEKGAFTGAAREGRTGIFELANNGTLLLDEIGEIPLNLQVKLLRALQEQEIYRVGGSKPIKLNVRIIAASNKNLWQMVKERHFREDLFYRLNVVPMEIPPLRNRREDIIPMTNLFLKQCNEKYGLKKKLQPEVYQIFEGYIWPGNVRELQNLVERLVVTSSAETITTKNLPPTILQKAFTPQPIQVQGLTTLKEAEEIVERELVARALRVGKSTRRAAEILGVTHSTIIRKMKQYELSGTDSNHNGSDAYHGPNGE
ncbi:MAG: sigma 54-interacting transcriptional regulator [Firmicutes bacterium]|nr:sigma 54-interacting transcriptional regulator [Bacillota bacterium]